MISYLNKLKQKKRILVIGDIMIDIYISGCIERISPEAPVPVFKYSNESFRLGGAANVANNLANLNQETYLMGCIGADFNGMKLKEALQENKINTEYVLEDQERPTIQKIRYIADNKQQILRMDIEEPHHISEKMQQRFFDILQDNIRSFDLIILSDYLKGMFPEVFTQRIIGLAKENNVKILVDPKDKNINKYKDSYMVKPNKKELRDLTGMRIDTEENFKQAALSLKSKLNLEVLIVTRGSEGITLIDEQNDIHTLIAEAKEVYDVTGAGDTVIAYLALCLVNGLNNLDAVKIANIAAGIKVSKHGTAIVKLNEIEDKLKSSTSVSKIITKENMAVKCNEYRKEGKTIVFTNGCFDILHYGHVSYLEKAKELGDILIIGVNSDDSIKRIKGEERPIINEENRLSLLSALQCVDYVVSFSEDTPYDLIKELIPDVLVKGGDYNPDHIVGKDIVEENGGKVCVLPFVQGESTSSIIDKIIKVYS